MSSAPATATLARAVAEHRSGAGLDRRGDATATGSSNTTAQPRQGLANQGWKDSHDAIFHADGSLAEGPIALAEVQGYVYAAKRRGGALARNSATTSARAQLDTAGGAARASVSSAFWCEEIGTYALALDGEKRPCRVRTLECGPGPVHRDRPTGARRGGRER